jgi:biopolymer transport protein ExbB
MARGDEEGESSPAAAGLAGTRMRKVTMVTRAGEAIAGLVVVCSVLMSAGPARAQDVAEAAVQAPPQAPPPAVVMQASPSIVPVQKELTLQVLVQQGGPILWVIIGLGFLALVLSLYLLLTVSPRREAPVKLLRRVSNLVRSGDVSGALLLCENRDELAARVLGAGLRMADQERFIIQEAMEGEGARGITELWQRISYLNNVGVIAPLLGLLGTVWGMIGAFNTIAFDNSQVRGIVVAYYVSMAMITTAGGLLVAIPALLIYYFLRGRVVRVIAHVETQAAEFVELLIRNRTR